MLQIVTECYRVLQGLQSISSASTWTNFWTCFLFFFSPTSPPYSLSWSQSRFHWQPSIYMWWGGSSYKKRSWSSNCMISTYVQSISFLLSPFQTRESQKVFTDLQQKFSCQYIARDASLSETVIHVNPSLIFYTSVLLLWLTPCSCLVNSTWGKGEQLSFTENFLMPVKIEIPLFLSWFIKQLKVSFLIHIVDNFFGDPCVVINELMHWHNRWQFPWISNDIVTGLGGNLCCAGLN